MSKKTDTDYLLHITEAIHRAITYTQEMSYEKFVKDTKTHDAVIRNIEIIGEAVKNLSDDIKVAYDEIPWKNMAGIRDKLIHHYFGVNFNIIWNVIQNDFPVIDKQIKNIIREMIKYDE